MNQNKAKLEMIASMVIFGTIGLVRRSIPYSSAMIAFCWYIWFRGVSVYAAVLVCLMGFAGAVVDSYLGAFVQAHYVDPDTGMLTENDEKDGRKLELAQGIRWVDNDMVNLMSNVFSSVFALGMGALIVKL